MIRAYTWCLLVLMDVACNMVGKGHVLLVNMILAGINGHGGVAYWHDFVCFFTICFGLRKKKGRGGE